MNPPAPPPPVATSHTARPKALAAPETRHRCASDGAAQATSAESGYKSDGRPEYNFQMSAPNAQTLYDDLRKVVKPRTKSDSSYYTREARSEKVRSMGNMPGLDEIQMENKQPLQTGNRQPSKPDKTRTEAKKMCCEKFKERKRHSSSCGNYEKGCYFVNVVLF